MDKCLWLLCHVWGWTQVFWWSAIKDGQQHVGVEIAISSCSNFMKITCKLGRNSQICIFVVCLHCSSLLFCTLELGPYFTCVSVSTSVDVKCIGGSAPMGWYLYREPSMLLLLLLSAGHSLAWNPGPAANDEKIMLFHTHRNIPNYIVPLYRFLLLALIMRYVRINK